MIQEYEIFYFLLDLFLKNFYFWSKYLSLIILRNVEKQATIKILYIQLKPVDLKGFFPSQHLPSITFWGFSFNTIPTVLLTHTQTGKCPIRNSCVYREVFINILAWRLIKFNQFSGEFTVRGIENIEWLSRSHSAATSLYLCSDWSLPFLKGYYWLT